MKRGTVIHNSYVRILYLSCIAGIATAWMLVGARKFPLSFVELFNYIILLASVQMGVINGVLLSPLAYYCLMHKDLQVIRTLIWGMVFVGVAMGITVSPVFLDKQDYKVVDYMVVGMNLYWIGALLYVKYKV